MVLPRVVNTPFGRGPRTDGYYIRTAAASASVPCITTVPGFIAAVQGIEALRLGPEPPVSLQELQATIGHRAEAAPTPPLQGAGA